MAEKRQLNEDGHDSRRKKHRRSQDAAEPDAIIDLTQPASSSSDKVYDPGDPVESLPPSPTSGERKWTLRTRPLTSSDSKPSTRDDQEVYDPGEPIETLGLKVSTTRPASAMGSSRLRDPEMPKLKYEPRSYSKPDQSTIPTRQTIRSLSATPPQTFDTAKSDTAAIGHLKLEVEKLKRENIECLESQAQTLRTSIEDSKRLATEYDDAMSKVNAALAEKADLEKTVSNLEKSLSRNMKERKRDYDRLKKSIAELNDTVETVVFNNDTLEAQLEAKNAELAKSKEKLAKLDNQVKVFSDLMAGLKRQREETDNEVIEKERQLSILDRTRKEEVRDLKKEKSDLQVGLDSLKAKMSDLKTSLRAKSDTIKALQESIAAKEKVHRAKLEAVEKSLDDLTKKHQDLERRDDLLKDDLAYREDANAKTKEELDKLRSENEDLKEKLNDPMYNLMIAPSMEDGSSGSSSALTCPKVKQEVPDSTDDYSI